MEHCENAEILMGYFLLEIEQIQKVYLFKLGDKLNLIFKVDA